MIRLQRTGKKKQAFFRLVLQEKTWKAKGKAMELLGFYNPHNKEKKFQEERIKHWISKGAKLSATAHNLLVDAKVIDGPKVKAWAAKKKDKKEEGETPAEPKVEAKETPSEDKPDEVKADVKETPAEEVKEEKVKEEPKKEEKKEAPKEDPKEEPVKEEAPSADKEEKKE